MREGVDFTAALAEPLYIVLFRSSQAPDAIYQPLVASSQTLVEYRAGTVTLPLGLAGGLEAALDPLWYCLHLPRTRFDFIRQSASSIKRGQYLHLPHHIWLWPVPWPADIVRLLAIEWPKLIIAPDDCLEMGHQLARHASLVIDVAPASTLTAERLPQDWHAIQAALGMSGPSGEWPTRLLGQTSAGTAEITADFVAHQLGSDQVGPRDTASSDPDEAILKSLHMQALLSTAAKFEEDDRAESIGEESFETALLEEKLRLRIPLSIAVPGVSARSGPAFLEKRLRREGVLRTETDGRTESRALQFLTAHRALSRGSTGFIASPISRQAFGLLAQLENLWTQSNGRPKPRSVWRLLRKLGRLVGGGLSEWEVIALRRASSITCFSEFPIGLATLPGETSPLALHAPISYRPLIPLTRAMQYELSDAPLYNMREGIKMLIAECISDDDPVGQLSRLGWEHVSQLLSSTPNTSVKILECRSIDQLKQAISSDQFDILLISAHGVKRENRSGIMCWSEVMWGYELDRVPPVVLLSACQVSPRGNGGVNITDLLFRNGAKAVLGTLAPVDVRRNAQILSRLFIYMSETLLGRHRARTLDEIWHFASTSNAFLDVISGSKRAERWAFSQSAGPSVVHEFMLTKSVGRLSPGTIYEQSEALLEEMADERGVGNWFRSWMRSTGYLPESLLYVFLGWPERILFGDAIPGLDLGSKWTGPVKAEAE